MTPCPQSSPTSFGTNAEAWGCGLDLLRMLRQTRMGDYQAVRNDEADALIHLYCQRLKRSGIDIVLEAIRRSARLIDEMVVLTLAALRNQFIPVGLTAIDVRMAVTLAVGFDPQRQHRLVQIARRSSVVWWDTSLMLYPKKDVINFVCGMKIDDREAAYLKEMLGELPTAPSKDDQQGGARHEESV